MLESKHYYIDLINSTKAYRFTSYYHYSGVGFKKAKINQGIFRKSDNLLVGVLQWGISAQEGIRLDRYVKEPITKNEYLELNRFCMADSEGKNAESEAISLGIKWIKQNRPDIRLLVSYAGRKEGNYGYIYQATNWEYLGYFISNGFWLLDGNERHQITLWYHHTRHGDGIKPFKESICDLFSDVRQTWTKQFIYIQRLDKKLTCASEILLYPKPSNEYPICTRTEIYKENLDILGKVQKREKAEVEYYYEPETWLFVKDLRATAGKTIAVYNANGELEFSAPTMTEASVYSGVSVSSISSVIKSGKRSKGFYFRKYKKDEEPVEQIDFIWICEIDGQKFGKQVEIADYCGVSRQSVSVSVQNKSKEINGRQITWNLEYKK